ncbi:MULTISPECIES: tetratricopeptide repeat protein [unclassified Pseudomonas]|uniref:tetratricopeptide repeat protein n=1 Tax=unclassified Pseudomonas TaxID=196821 RepID=UPI0030D79831
MKDLNNLDVTVHSDMALGHFNEAVSILCRFGDPVPQAQEMLAIEPTFVMGQVFNAHISLWSTDRDDLKAAVDSLNVIRSVASGMFNRRERMHVAVLEAWVAGNLHRASVLLDELLIEYPTDILALLSGHQIDFLVGDASNLHERVARVLGAWDSQHPLYGYLLGMLSFGQEESGHFELAEQTAREAVSRNPKDIWGIHAVAHALEMQNNYVEGVSFMRKHEATWSTDNGMVSHNAVHLDLFLLESNDLTGALEAYDKYIHWTNVQPMPMVLLDGSSVLWRVYLEGHDVADRAKRLADSWRSKIGQNFYSFNDAHAMIALAASGDFATASDQIKSLKEYVKYGDRSASNHFMTREVGLPVCEALLAFTQGDYAKSIERLMSVNNKSHLFGGSLAQRDVFSRTLLESAIRAKRKPLANALISERLIHRPQSTYNHIKAEQIKSL